jgi:hypothetical protein
MNDALVYAESAGILVGTGCKGIGLMMSTPDSNEK